MFFLHLIEHILQMALSMSWEMLWPLTLGLLLSATVQSLVPHKSIAGALGKNNVGAIALSSAMGAASSSCSYAAVTLARSLFQQGATLANSIIFEFGSTNLVFDLGVVIFALLGWQFLAAQYLGGILMVVLLALLFKLTLTPALEQAALTQARSATGAECHAHAKNISHYFYADLFSILPDLLFGILIASVLSVIVPSHIWQQFFFSNHPHIAVLAGPLIAPFISMASFVCSIGNVPLAVVLWQNGISFGGVIAFIFADLLIIPILDIYRKYYGVKPAVYLFVISYIAMAAAGLLTEFIFSHLGLVPTRQMMQVLQLQHLRMNYVTALDIAALVTIVLLGWRFFRTGGQAALKHNHCRS